MAAFPQPSEDDIGNFLAFAGIDLPRSEVIARLKNNNCSVEQALGEYFEDAEKGAANKYRWDDQQFNSDREGVYNNHGIAFDIQGPDVTGPSYQYGAPSRPPSRTSNNKSPFSKIIDLTADAAAANPSMSKTWGEGDSEFERALAISKAEAGLPQESGITTSTSEVHFGPANRSQYEPSEWGMVSIGNTSAQEILVDPEPAERKRDIDAPAFFKPSVEDHHLGALFTIYHEIPIIREVFLDRIDVLSNYGYDKEWWMGKAIELPVLIGDDVPPEYEVNREVQRLMAFLDKTDRSYGSVEALANLREVKRVLLRSVGLENAVLKAWCKKFNAPEHQAILNKLFSKGVASEETEREVESLAILNLTLPKEDSLHETIYDMADDALWPELNPLDPLESPYLLHVADVFVFQIKGDEWSKNVDFPAEWYPDRYLKLGREAAAEMRIQQKYVQEQLEQIRSLEVLLTNHQISRDKTITVTELFNASLKHDEAQIEDDKIREELIPDLDYMKIPRKTLNLSAQLRKVMESIDKKLIALNEEKDKAREALRNLSKLYTEQSDDPAALKLHKYSLRGVSTTKSTMYICRRAEPDLIDMNLDNEVPPSTNGDQWWKIQYATSSSNPVTVEKTQVENVLEAAKNETKNVFLVYASEKAMEFPIKTLPTPLENFVQLDNQAFKAEFDLDSEDTQTQLASPGKRKFDYEISDDSQDLGPARWEGGSSPRDGESTINLMDNEMSGDDASWDAARTASHSLAARLIDGPEDVKGQKTHEISVGVDPSLLIKDSQSSGQEMQERRSSMRMMAGRAMSTDTLTTIDNMDLDVVMEDENVKEESAAVKHVGFAD